VIEQSDERTRTELVAACALLDRGVQRRSAA
jgi:hypothetical protein